MVLKQTIVRVKYLFQLGNGPAMGDTADGALAIDFVAAVTG